MENKRYSECLNETYDLFKSQGISILGKSFEEVMSDPNLFEGYVSSLTEGAGADARAQMAQLMVNTNAHLLTEGSVAGIAPISSLSGPMIRKLWPTLNLKNAVKCEVATTPSFLISYTRPYYEDETGERHYVPRYGLLAGQAGEYSVAKDLTGNYIVRNAAITNAHTFDFDAIDGEDATASASRTKHNLEVSTSSKIKRQPIDADFELVKVAFESGTNGFAGIGVHKKLGVENVIVADVKFSYKATTVESTTTYNYGEYDKTGYTNIDATILVRVNQHKGTAQVSVIGCAVPVPVQLKAHRSVEYNEVVTSWSFDVAREDIRIGTGEHFSSPLTQESLTDLKALYQIDGTKECVDLMTQAMALGVDGKIMDFLKDNFLNQPGNAMDGEFASYPTAANYLAVFDVKPAVGFAGGPKAWREELKPVIDHLAARIKNQTFLGTGMFNIVGNPLDIMLITNVDWQYRAGQAVDGVVVNYSVGQYNGSAYTYKLVSSEIVPQGKLYIVFIPEEKNQLTYNYWAYSFSTELGYRDPNRAMVPAVTMLKRDVMKSFMPAIACVQIVGNNANGSYDPFRDNIDVITHAGNAA